MNQLLGAIQSRLKALEVLRWCAI